MFSGTGLGNRLNGIILSINIVVLVIIAVITTSSSNAAARAQTLNRFSVKNTSAVRALEQVFRQVYSTANEFKNGLAEVDVLDANLLRAYVREAVAADGDNLIHRISIMRPDKSIAMFFLPNAQLPADYIWRIFRQPADMPTDNHILAARQNQRLVWFYQARAHYDQGSRPAVSLALPYTVRQEEGSFAGVIWFDIPLVTLHDATTRILNDQGLLADTTGGYTLLLDAEGNILTEHNIFTDTTTARVNTAALMERIDDAIQSNGVYAITEPFAASSAIASRSTVTQTGWRLVSVLPLEEVPVLPAQIFIPIGVVSAVGLFVLAWLIGRFVERSVVAPLMDLGGAAQEIGSGDLRYYIGHQGQDDEIGRLAQALESMKRNVAHSHDELSRWSRTLEQRVIQRTRELDESKRQSEARAGQLQAVYDESLLVVNESQLRPVLNAFTTRLMTLLKASYCAIWLLTEDRERLQQVASSDGGLSLGSSMPTMPAGEGLVGNAVSQATAVVVNDYVNYPGRYMADSRPAPFVRGIAVPLMFVGKPIGAVIMGRPADAPVFNDADGRLLALFANLVSPSVRNAQLFVRVNEAVQAAERANEVKTRFLASVTHELRTPLNLIINNMDFMRIGAFGDVTPEQVSRLNQTVRSAEHLLYLINDLLDVSKIDAGEMQLFIQPADITPVLDDSVDNIYAFMEKLEEKAGHLQFNVDIEKDLPKIPVDSRRLRQVLTNLLTNAVKFTKEGEVRLTVKREEKGIRFSVSDTGIGIPAAELPNLFAAFERTRQAKESNIEGTGLGLAISKFLVERHGGELKVESVSGKGSTFWFIIPFEPVQEARPVDAQIQAVLTTKPE